MEISEQEREKKVKELLEKTGQKYKKLKESGKLSSRDKTNPLNAFDLERAKELLKAHLKDGKTTVPIDLKAYWESCGLKVDFNHAKDKVRRYFEIVVLSEYVDKKKASEIVRFYGPETTKLLREFFSTGHNFITESNKESEDTFLHIDIRDILTGQKRLEK